jgi:predicted MFS family arabinose efflux permease
MKSQRKRALVLMIVVVGLLNADQNLINPTLGLIEMEFGISDADIGLMSGLFTILGAVVSLFVGYLSDKGNRKMLFVGSVLLSEVPCLLTAFSASYTQFFTCRILTGFGLGASFPVVFSFIGDLYGEQERPQAVAWMTTSMGVGLILGQLVGGYAGPALGWRAPFVMVSVPTLASVAAFFLLVKEPRRGAAEASVDSLVAQGYLYPRSITFADYRKLFRNRTNLLLFLQGLLGTVPCGAIPLFIVKFLNENRSLSVTQATTAFLLFGIGHVAGTILGGYAGGRLFKRKPALLPRFCSATTFLGAACTLYLLVGFPKGSLLWTSILALCAAFFIPMTGANMRTMLLDTNVPENRGAIFSLFNLTDSVGAGMGKYAGGMLSVALGLSAALSVSVAFWIPCAALLWGASFFFTRDVVTLRARMKALAVAMQRAGKGR